MLGRGFIAALATLSLGAMPAVAATLRIRVAHRVHIGLPYTIRITGSFSRREVSRRAYLMEAIQFSGARCQETAQLENNVGPIGPQWYVDNEGRYGAFERHKWFTFRDNLTPGQTGERRVCAYLYPKFITPTDHTQPIATADVFYRALNSP